MEQNAGSVRIYINLGDAASRAVVIDVQTRLLGEPWIKMTTVQSAAGFPSHFMVAVKDSYRDRLHEIEGRLREAIKSVVGEAEPQFSVRLGEEPLWEDDEAPSREG